MKPDSMSMFAPVRPAMMRAEPGTVDWVDMWVGHARAGARLMVAGPLPVTHTVNPDLAERVRALDKARLIFAVWQRVPVGRAGHVYELLIIRRERDLPAAWPSLAPPRPPVAVAKLNKPRAVPIDGAGLSAQLASLGPSLRGLA